MCPAIVSGIVTGDAPVSYRPIVSLSLVTVPEVKPSFLLVFKVTNANDKQPRCTNHSFVLGCLSNASWQCTDAVPEMEKKINVTVLIKFETRQLSIQQVLLVKVRTTRQIQEYTARRNL